MAFYEVVFIVRQDISATGAHDVAQMLKDLIVKLGGVVFKLEYAGLRALAYPIARNPKGHYTLMVFSCSHTVLKEIEHKMRIHTDVIRFLTVKLDRMPPRGPSALVQREREVGERSGYVARSMTPSADPREQVGLVTEAAIAF